MNYLGDFPTGATIYVPFHTFDSNGASITLTGLAVTDIEIYKNGSVTQRASDAGYTLLDTDGIDFDSITGIHGFSIDTSDNTDAGFFAAGNEYMVVVSSVTVDTRTVNFVAATFSIERSGGALALLKHATYGLSAIETLVDGVETTLGTPAGASIAADLVTIDDFLDTEIAAIKAKTDNLPASPAATGDIPSAATIADAVWDEARAGHVAAGSFGEGVASVQGNITGNVAGSVGSVTGNVGGSVASVTAGVTVAAGGIDTGDISATALNEIADAVLDRNMATGTDSGTNNTTTRTVRQALRVLRNKVSIAAGTATVTKEDDTTTSWTAAISTTAGDPISSSDPT